MKTILTLFSLTTFIGIAQLHSWEPITEIGFGLPVQNTAPEMEVFNDTLYVATSATSPTLARLYRSGSGDAGDFAQVTTFDPPLNFDKSIHAFGVDENLGYIWCGTGNGILGGMIYRSSNGVVWDSICDRGFGVAGRTGVSPHMMTFQGPTDTEPYLYAGIGSHGGTEPGVVMRIPASSTNPADWEPLVDFDFDPAKTIISYFEVWGDTIYFGTDGGGELWQSVDGTTFTQNVGIGSGFGFGNFVISSIEVFKDYMYVTTTNFSGSHMYRSAEGVIWEPVTTDAFGKADTVSELRSLRESFGKLWVTGYTDTSVSTGTPIWYTENGLDWERSNLDGFGIPENDGQNAVVIGFKGKEYFAGPNYGAGAQLWRTVTTSSLDENDQTKTLIFPNPVEDYLHLNISKELAQFELLIYDQMGRLVLSEDFQGATSLILDLSNLSRGTYQLLLQSEGAIKSREKFVK